jgi:hypothetical protein
MTRLAMHNVGGGLPRGRLNDGQAQQAGTGGYRHPGAELNPLLTVTAGRLAQVQLLLFAVGPAATGPVNLAQLQLPGPLLRLPPCVVNPPRAHVGDQAAHRQADHGTRIPQP